MLLNIFTLAIDNQFLENAMSGLSMSSSEFDGAIGDLKGNGEL